jgi:hypothetical protein
VAVAARTRPALGPLPPGTITYKSALLVKDVLERLEGLAPAARDQV